MTKIIETLRDDALAAFAGQAVAGSAFEAHTSFRYMAERGRKQTFGSYVNMVSALEAAGVTVDYSGTDTVYKFPA
jgi:hypothetical protein